MKNKSDTTSYGHYEAPEHGILAFPILCASLGGARMVRYSARFAWITKASGEVVRVSRSSLPTVDKWTAFSLADAVA